MATNDAVAAYTGQQEAAAAEYKDGWANAPASGGSGQFPSSVPFAGVPTGLTSTPIQDAASALSGQANAVQARQAGPIDGLPTTPTVPASPAPAIPAEPNKSTLSNFTAAAPYVQDVTDSGDVVRQAERPERLAIDDTMSPDEQYRRAWQNEANGFYNNDVEKVAAPAPAADETPAAAPAPAPVAPVEYGISYNGQTDASDTVATIYDKATNKTVHQFAGGQGGELFTRLGGVGTVNSDQLKQYTGWSAPTTENTGAGA